MKLKKEKKREKNWKEIKRRDWKKRNKEKRKFINKTKKYVKTKENITDKK